MKTIAPFYLSLTAALMIVTYVPAFSLWLPRLAGYLRADRRHGRHFSFATLAGLPAGRRASRLRSARRSASASSIWASARSTARTRPSTPTRVLARDPRWGICGVSLKTPRATAALAAQDGLYTRAHARRRRASAARDRRLRETLFAGADRAGADRALRRSARPRRLADRHREGLLPRPGDRRASISRIRTSSTTSRIRTRRCSAVGLLVAGLAARERDAAPARSPSSAATTCRTTAARSRASCARSRRRATPRSPTGSRATSAFPCTMVDRIVPATTAADVAEAARRLGVADAAPVVAEPFDSWVIEDRFVAARPRVGGGRRANSSPTSRRSRR